LVISK